MPRGFATAEELQNRYLGEAIETATPAARLGMLLDRLELDLQRADAAFDGGDLAAINDNLVHAQEILLALAGTLRIDVWEGAAQLAGLYYHLHGELLAANMAKDRDRLAKARPMVAQLAGAWRAAISGDTTVAAGAAIAGGAAIAASAAPVAVPASGAA